MRSHAFAASPPVSVLAIFRHVLDPRIREEDDVGVGCPSFRFRWIGGWLLRAGADFLCLVEEKVMAAA